MKNPNRQGIILLLLSIVLLVMAVIVPEMTIRNEAMFAYEQGVFCIFSATFAAWSLLHFRNWQSTLSAPIISLSVIAASVFLLLGNFLFFFRWGLLTYAK